MYCFHIKDRFDQCMEKNTSQPLNPVGKKMCENPTFGSHKKTGTAILFLLKENFYGGISDISFSGIITWHI